MRHLTAAGVAGFATAVASLSCAGPALADIGGPSTTSVTVAALVVLGAGVAGVVVVCVLVLRSIARSRHQRRLYCPSCRKQVAEGAPYCLSCGALQPTGRESAEGTSEPPPGVHGAVQADAAVPEDDRR